MSCRLLLVLSLILAVSFFPAFSASAEAARTNSKKSQTFKKRMESGGKKRHRHRTSYLPSTRQRAFSMDEEYLVSEIEPEKDGILCKALSLLGIRYRFGGSDYRGIDCSAFVKKVFSVHNLPLPRTAREQFAIGKVVLAEELKEGDLLFFRTYADFPSHVGIYVGNDRMIHASSTGRRVMISKIDTEYFRSRYLGARRITSKEESLSELVGDTESVANIPALIPE